MFVPSATSAYHLCITLIMCSTRMLPSIPVQTMEANATTNCYGKCFGWKQETLPCNIGKSNQRSHLQGQRNTLHQPQPENPEVFCWTKKQSSLKVTAGLNNFRTWSKFWYTTGPYLDAIIPKKMLLFWRKPSSTHQWLIIQENNTISSRQTPCHPDPGVVKGWHINHWICPPTVMTQDSYDRSISTFDIDPTYQKRDKSISSRRCLTGINSYSWILRRQK